MTAPRGLLVELGGLEPRAWYAATVNVAEGLVRSNVVQLRAADLDISGLEYVEHTYLDLGDLGPAWPVRGALEVTRRRRGNCLDLACLAAASQRVRGSRATVQLLETPDGRQAHAVVLMRGRRYEARDLLP